MTDFAKLIATARDSTLDDEQRLLAVMTITAAHWAKRARLLDNTAAASDDLPPRPESRPRIQYRKGLAGLAGIRAAGQPTTKERRKAASPITDYTRELMLKVVRVENGIRIGLSYLEIGAAILERFPVVPHGAHRGKPPITTLKSMHDFAATLRKLGHILPYRPRTPRARTGGTRAVPTQCAVCGAAIIQTYRGRTKHYCGHKCRLTAARSRAAISGRMSAAERRDTISTRCALVGQPRPYVRPRYGLLGRPWGGRPLLKRRISHG